MTEITVSNHNWQEFEEVLNDMSVAVLKLQLVYHYICNHGFTNEANSLIGEAINTADNHQNSYRLFYECVSDGKEFNLNCSLH